MQQLYSSQEDRASSHIEPTVKQPSADASRDVLAGYLAWLAADARHNQVANAPERLAKYRTAASRPVTAHGQPASPFAPFRHQHSALQTLTPGQALTLLALLLALLAGGLLWRATMAVALLALLTLFYLGDLLLHLSLALRTLAHPADEPPADAVVPLLAPAAWPRYTILCPLYHEAPILPQFAQAMTALDYPADHLEILLLTEPDDAPTQAAIRALHLPPHFHLLTVPPGSPRTKPRACNFGLLHATGDYIVIYDAEDIPDPLQLKKAVLTFANHGPDLACVQAKLSFYNSTQNLLTRWFTAEYAAWFDLILPGLQQGQLPLPLGGTSNHFRTELLRLLGGWDAFNVTEDCDLGLRLHHYRLQVAMLDSTTFEEAPSHLHNWLRQRSRWIKGYMQTYLVNMRQPLGYVRQGRLKELLWLQVVLGGKTALLFLNPLMWLLLGAYLALRPLVGGVYAFLFPPPILYLASLCLVLGNFFYLYTLLMGCLKRGHYGLIKWTLAAPLYWALMSLAACLALSQLIRKPHFWEKTLHGFHLPTATPHQGGLL